MSLCLLYCSFSVPIGSKWQFNNMSVLSLLAKKGELIETQHASRWILVKTLLNNPHASVHAFLPILNGYSHCLQEHPYLRHVMTQKLTKVASNINVNMFDRIYSPS